MTDSPSGSRGAFLSASAGNSQSGSTETLPSGSTADASGEAALVPRLTELLGAAPLVAQTGTPTRREATGEAALVPRLTELARGGTACRADTTAGGRPPTRAARPPWCRG